MRRISTTNSSRLIAAVLLLMPLSAVPQRAGAQEVPAAVSTSTSAPPPSALLMAVMSGDASEVKTMLASRVDPNGRDVQGKTPLMLAAAQGRSDLIQLLLEGNADVNAQDAEGRTALHHVLANPNTAVEQVKPKKKRGGFGGFLDKAKDQGSAITNRVGKQIGAERIGAMLKSSGITRFVTQGLGQTLLMQAVPFLSLAQAFQPGEKMGWSAVLGSAMMGGSGGASGALTLLGGGGTMDAGAWTGLMSSAKKGNPKVLQAMGNLSADASPEQRAAWEAFLAASSSGDTAKVQRMLADPTLAPLLDAARQGLTAASAELPGMDGGVSIVKALIARGANTTVKDNSGKTARERAQDEGLEAIVKLLAAER
jgi:ankyrin repeat protein